MGVVTAKTGGARKIFLAFFMLIFVVCLLSSSALATSSNSENDETVKVFFPMQDGFACIDDGGNYSGYTYEYLMRIAQLTGWKYEFCPVELTNENLVDGLDKVSRGEMHLAGTMNYSDQLAEKYTYSIPYGDTSFALVALDSNASLNARTLIDYPNLRVAIIESAVGQNGVFDKFCKENSIEYQPVYAKNNSECRQLLLNGLADATISKDIARNADLKIIAKFTSSPFYFAASKDNVELIDTLNSALLAIEVADPSFRTTMHDKYFPNDAGLDLALTPEERAYLDTKPVIKVAVMDGRAPIQSYDEETGKFSGILIDIIDLISQRSGLQFELINVASEDDMHKSVDSGSYDVVAGIPYYYGHNAASGTVSRFLLTPPVFSSPIVRINNLHGNSNNDKVLVSSSIKELDIKSDIVYSNSIEEMFRLVNSGEYGEAYLNGYMAQHFAEDGAYPNVLLSFIPNGNYELCLGVSRECDLRLVSVLTQAIATISDNELVDIVYKNTNHKMDNNIWRAISRDPTQVIVPVIVFLIVVLGLLILLFVRTSRLNKLIAKEKNLYKAFAELDRLSQTYNNTEFKLLAAQYLSSVDSEPAGALIVCDIDDFKRINDTFGHLKGDEVISKMGCLMNSIFRDGDIVGRLGGDEFVVLLKNVSSLNTIEKRCVELKEKSLTLVPDITITISMGVAVFSGKVEFGELFHLADSALYDVKNSGKNSYKILLVDPEKR